jgi:hypothetical protein
MKPSKLAITGMVCLALHLGTTTADAQSRARRDSGYVRGGRATRDAVPRSRVDRREGVRSGQFARASRYSRAGRYAPLRPIVRYRSPVYRSYRYNSRGYRPYAYRYGYRPGFSGGVYLGAPYGFYGSAYPYPYPYARPYSYPYPYAHPAPGYGYPAGAPYGGVRLEVLPRHAEVLVDGYYAGTVDDFDGTFQRLELEEGAHNIEIRAPGYQPAAFDVNVLLGQTIKYRADLIPLP